jgi:hypothetical protein
MTRLWHNAFVKLTGSDLPEGGEPLTGAVAPSGANPIGAAVIASVGQGVQLEDQARALQVELNAGRELVSATADAPLRVAVGPVEFTVIAPAQKEIDHLRELWKKDTEKGVSPAAIAAAYSDTSIPNTSSIVLHAKCDGKTMLLTGDARGDLIIAGLRHAGLLQGDHIDVDLLKLPHHGSDRNVETSFFRTVRADQYVISADGKFGNPENATLAMIADAREGDDFTIHLTNHTGRDGLGARLDKFLAEQKQLKRPLNVNFRDEQKVSMTVDLGDSIAP